MRIAEAGAAGYAPKDADSINATLREIRTGSHLDAKLADLEEQLAAEPADPQPPDGGITHRQLLEAEVREVRRKIDRGGSSSATSGAPSGRPRTRNRNSRTTPRPRSASRSPASPPATPRTR
jgi:hypothetical protein